jgi:hypothetical protein
MEVISTQRTNAANLDTSTMVRSWTNTNPATQGITSVKIRAMDGKLRIAIAGAAQGTPFNWGEIEITVIYAENPSSSKGMAFSAKYDFGFLETLIEGNVNAGLLVLAAFHTFRDGSDRSNYFSREFFHEVAQ